MKNVLIYLLLVSTVLLSFMLYQTTERKYEVENKYEKTLDEIKMEIIKNSSLELVIDNLNSEITLNKIQYTSTIKEIVEVVQITDSYLFIGGFSEEDTDDFNLKKYEDMLTLNTSLSELLHNTENFFDERVKYIEKTPSVWPIENIDDIRISSPFGDRYSPFSGKKTFHNGIDLVAPAYTKIKATAEGVVVQNWIMHPIYGKLVIVEHANGIRTWYAHMSKVWVHEGDRIKKGASIGRIGNTGVSTGRHLHYSVERNGKFVDPTEYLRYKQEILTKKE